MVPLLSCKLRSLYTNTFTLSFRKLSFLFHCSLTSFILQNFPMQSKEFRKVSASYAAQDSEICRETFELLIYLPSRNSMQQLVEFNERVFTKLVQLGNPTAGSRVQAFWFRSRLWAHSQTQTLTPTSHCCWKQDTLDRAGNDSHDSTN